MYGKNRVEEEFRTGIKYSKYTCTCIYSCMYSLNIEYLSGFKSYDSLISSSSDGWLLNAQKILTYESKLTDEQTPKIDIQI
jgi:hypothetical protein